MSIGRERETSELGLEQPDSGWNAATLRGACLMLSRANPESVARISVNVRCPTDAEATRWLRGFTIRLAGEYGLSAEIVERHSGVCVVFTRRPIGA
jgi:hypothetical protein